MANFGFVLSGHTPRKESRANIHSTSNDDMFLFKRMVFPAAVLACFFMQAKTLPNIDIIDRKCLNQLVLQVGDAERAINNVVDKLLTDTVTQSYNFEFSNKVGDDQVWGNAACNGNLSPDDCKRCLQVSVDLIDRACGFAGGAHCKLADCRLRYEPYEFHGDW